jgi:uncharacterized protein (UPF0332 family)
MEKKQLDLSNYRMEKAKDELDTADLMFKNNKFSQSINRSYYAMFHSDYNDFFIAFREDAQVQLENAEKFLKRIEEYLKTILNNEKRV